MSPDMGEVAVGRSALRRPTPAAWTLLSLALVAVIGGGLVAAVTGPLQLTRGSWLAAYLVLVCGVAQGAIGAAQTWLTAEPLSPDLAWVEVVAWNLGNAAVIIGTLLGAALIVDFGGVLLLVAVVMALVAARAVRPKLTLLGWAYRIVLVIVAVSIPIGLTLAHLRG